jgi:hypothetical protein
MTAQAQSTTGTKPRFVTSTSKSQLTMIVGGVTNPFSNAQARHVPRDKGGLRLSAALATYCFAITTLLAISNVGHWWPLWLSIAISSVGIAISNALRLNRAT